MRSSPRLHGARCLSVMLASFALAVSAAAQPACLKPETPACSTQKGPFARDADYDACRHETLRFKGEMERFAACHRDAGRADEVQAAEAELERAVTQLNRRARGEAD